VKERRFAAAVATAVLIVLPVLDFLRDGRVSETLLAPLVLIAFSGGGFAADQLVRARLIEWIGDRRRTDDHP
jgi:hypothetical protein